MNNILDAIAADVEVEMTSDLIRAFKIEGCNPKCHCCGAWIEAGDTFKLACIKSFRETNNPHISHSIEESDEMLCVTCTPEKLTSKRLSLHKKHEKDMKEPSYEIHTGYTRKHKIDLEHENGNV